MNALALFALNVPVPRDKSIPRDLTCWYCRRGEHARCVYRSTCACYPCLTAENPNPEEN